MAKTVKLTVNTLLTVYHIADRLLQHFFFLLVLYVIAKLKLSFTFQMSAKKEIGCHRGFILVSEP